MQTKSFFPKYLFVLLYLFLVNKTYASTLQDTIRVLAIGNSFSEDAVENNLYELANATNKHIIIGNLYIGGAPLELHGKNLKDNAQIYSYRKINANGHKSTIENFSIEKAMNDEKWTHITLQQASPLSGEYDVIMQDLPELVTYIRNNSSIDTKVLYHQTWAYQSDSNHEGFANYGNNQKIMYQQIVSVAKKLDRSNLINYIIPTGTAIQNLRTSSIDDHITRDGYHLELTFGRFTAACVWYQTLYCEDVRDNPYYPSTITAAQAKICKQAAFRAIKRPFRISSIKG